MRAADPSALGAWYRDCLGLDADENGVWQQGVGPTVLRRRSSRETDYFGSRAQQTMLNFRVSDLDAMLAQLRAKGADVAEETQEMEGVGRFGWVTDPRGQPRRVVAARLSARGSTDHEASSHVQRHQEHEHPRRAGRPAGQTDCRVQRALHSHRRAALPRRTLHVYGFISGSAAAPCAAWVGNRWECWSSPRCPASRRSTGFRRSRRPTLCWFGAAVPCICATGCGSPDWPISCRRCAPRRSTSARAAGPWSRLPTSEERPTTTVIRSPAATERWDWLISRCFRTWSARTCRTLPWPTSKMGRRVIGAGVRDRR